MQLESAKTMRLVVNKERRCQREDRRRRRPEKMNPRHNFSRLSHVKKVSGTGVSAFVPDVNMLKCTCAG